MARSLAAQAKVEAFRNYLEGVAKKMADDLWGPKGPAWGTKLTEMEDLALAAREVFTQKFLELGPERQAVAVQEQRPAPAAACPSCQRPFAEAAAAAPRSVQTQGGEVHWEEPQEYCPRCRRAFFPSEQEFGD